MTLCCISRRRRQRDPNVALPFYVSEIVSAAETARGNEKIVEGPGYDRPGG
jgi:hypothetical protein